MKAKLYYGNSECSIEGHKIRSVIINYTGAIEIDSKTPNSFAILAKNNKIIIFPHNGKDVLTNLFTYEGNFKINSVTASNHLGEKVVTLPVKVMDFAELLGNAEDITANSEDLKNGYQTHRRIAKTSVKQQIIPNLNTNRSNANLFLKDGSNYSGDFHIVVDGGAAYTGKGRTEHSELLYFKQMINGEVVDKLISTDNPSGIPLAGSVSRIGNLNTGDNYGTDS